ncbi:MULTISPECIES: DUF1963 domain-containing protein [unclassified Streptomyces]|uniref:DUF1963 domain-containing protein n=1 Tax=Streptomyces sp. NBC_00723 TaxID=2903673 RepID=UPI0009EA2446
MNWPSAGNSPLPFIYSVDCGALPRVDGFDRSADGTLLFFLDHEEDHLDDTGRYARVVYVQDGADTAVAEPPTPSSPAYCLVVVLASRSTPPAPPRDGP